MSAKTKIVVLRMKELIYTGIFAGLAVLLVILFMLMFGEKDNASAPKQDSSPSSAVSSLQTAGSELMQAEPLDQDKASYIPGIYTASLSLSGQNLDVRVTVDAAHILDIRLLNLNESITTMYPLMEPALENLSRQLLEQRSTKELTYTDDTKYTSYILLRAIEAALQKAQASPS